IHLPQLLNEEAIADEFSNWEQVSSVAAKRFARRHMAPQTPSRTLPSACPPSSGFLTKPVDLPLPLC
ncbi:hypothetical protein C3R19_09945, partial [Blautia producta]